MAVSQINLAFMPVVAPNQELEKEPEHSEARLFLADSTTPLDSRADTLVEKLNHTFLQKEDILHGYLSPHGDQ